MDLLRQRLYTQRLAGPPLERPEDVVRLLGAVQSQDYPGAKWSLGQRVRKGTDAGVDEAFSSGRMLRTHILRPTWHFVAPDDIRWMLQLTSPRVQALHAYRYRQLELDEALLRRSDGLFAGALQGGNQLTRVELAAVLHRGGIAAADFGLVKSVSAGDSDESLASAAGVTPGTPAYMAPEMAHAEAVDGLADLYSLGCVAYFLLTGRLVFEAETAIQMIVKHLQEDPVPLSADGEPGASGAGESGAGLPGEAAGGPTGGCRGAGTGARRAGGDTSSRARRGTCSAGARYPRSRSLATLGMKCRDPLTPDRRASRPRAGRRSATRRPGPSAPGARRSPARARPTRLAGN